MTSTALDPAATITAAVDELLDELRQTLAGDVDRAEVDGLLDTISRALGRARRRITTARRRAAAKTEQPAKPTMPAAEPASTGQAEPKHSPAVQ